MSQKSSENYAHALTAHAPRWNPTNQIPEDETIDLIFHGLLAFCYNSDEHCEIGAHNDAEDHSPSLEIFEDGTRKRSFSGGELRGLGANIITLTAEDPDPPGVFFFMKDGELDRQHPEDNPYDFRWLLDLEGPDFYDRPPGMPLEQNLGFYRPKLVVHHGVFYTADTTRTQFKRSLRGDRILGHVSYYVAAKIKLRSGTALLKGGELEYTFHAGKKYQVTFANVCSHNGKACKFEPNSLDKEERNDFFEYYKTFQLPPAREEFELKIHGPAIEHDHSTRRLGFMGEVDPRSTDPAPCGGVGFGQSPGFP
jgi:hypothetical protein